MQNTTGQTLTAFRMSAHISYVDIPLNGETCAGIYSFQGRRFFRADQALLKQLQKQDFSGLDDVMLKELVNNDMLLPTGIDEEQHMEDMLQLQDKLTLLVDRPVPLISWPLLQQVIRQHDIKNLSFVLMNTGDDLQNIITAIRCALSEAGVDMLCSRYFMLSGQEDSLRLVELSEADGEWNHLSPEDRKPGNAALRSVEQVSVACSNYPWIKELPLSGLLTDPVCMQELLSGKITPQCRNCNALAACGGYVGHCTVQCPALIKDLNNTIAQKLYVPAHHSGGIPGVNNSLAISNEIAALFEKIIEDNTGLHERLMVHYLVKEYNKGFLFSRNGHLALAELQFRKTDAIVASHAPEGFCHCYAQAIAASTSSYLAYRKGEPDRAAALTDAGIGAGLALQHYRSSAVMVLFISQLLMNKARVLLAADDLEAWSEVTLQNIHFLLHHHLPVCYGMMQRERFNELPRQLKDGMLLEIVNQVLKLNIKNRQFQVGEQLICSIDATCADGALAGQIANWVSLCKAAVNKDETFLEAHLGGFLQQENETNDISTLKAYLRTLIKKAGISKSA
ncbi:hypothetical protein [Chitinophaga sp. HK235]|uniref:hypothetical protein n=1 Tax=Chitinophaga sp. HK235 TaxID=2952571 RepID=UPI001BA49AC4|nr:hypothetical protein [Chitinophaga sp. HK235]